MAIQNGMENIKMELEKRGFHVVYIENYNYPIDAIIYEGSSFNISHISSNNMPAMTMDKRASYGVFIINSCNKSIDEIESMLNKRHYSPLF
ncbi:UNVERIFIED_CONTAM: uncharacterized protein UPF0180 [Acetivibrio alkalicellulosi]